MSTRAMSAFVLVQESDGLSLGEIVANIPRDPAAIVVYLILFAAVFVIWKYGRSTSSGQKQ